jgi:hypothetical protein
MLVLNDLRVSQFENDVRVVKKVIYLEADASYLY